MRKGGTMSDNYVQTWKIENADHYQQQQREYRKKRYANNPDILKEHSQKWRANNPEKIKVINYRKTILYKKMVEILKKNNSPLMKEYSFDELYLDLINDCNILFCVLESEVDEYLYSNTIGSFYYRRNFYMFAQV